MAELKELLLEQMRDLLDAETQLIDALPKMAEAAHHPKLKESFEKHLLQTQGQAERLRKAFEIMGEEVRSKSCKGMTGLVEEGEETIQHGRDKAPLAADLALIAAAQKVEHYEIASYGTARGLARQLAEYDCARLLSHSLGEEETTDFLLTAIADPLTQQGALDEMGAEVNLDTGEHAQPTRRKKSPKKAA